MPRPPAPPLPSGRLEAVETAWAKVSQGAETVTLDQLTQAYDAARHPRVLDGNMSVIQAREALLRQFENIEDGTVGWPQFLAYHVKVSNEVDRSRSLDREGSFLSIVALAWRLDQDPNAALEPTGIIPTTLDCPTGLAATKNLDLVWPEDGVLYAFKGTIKCRFARSLLPPSIRGCFAFQEELTGFTVKTRLSRSALIAPLSIVWLNNETGEVFGLRDVVAPNVDVPQLPSYLQDVLLQADAATKRYGNITWLELARAYNPMYKKSSEAFGVGTAEHALDVVTLKKAVFEGTACGLAWHGHTGKFTDSFNGGPYKFSGLNTVKTKPAFPV